MSTEIGSLGNRLPYPEGIAEGGELDRRTVGQPLPRRSFSALEELLTDYALFTPALLYVFAPPTLVHDPLQDFVRAFKISDPATLFLPRPVIRGLSGERERWCFVLYAIPRPLFLPFMAWARTLVFVDRPARTLIRIRPMLAHVPDVVALANHTVLERIPLVEIGVLALDTNKGNVLLDDAECPFAKPAKVQFFPQVFRDTEVYANAVFSEDPNPERRVEEARIDPALGLTPAEAYLLERCGDRREPLRPPPTVPLEALPKTRREAICDFLRKARGQ